MCHHVNSVLPSTNTTTSTTTTTTTSATTSTSTITASTSTKKKTTTTTTTSYHYNHQILTSRACRYCFLQRQQPTTTRTVPLVPLGWIGKKGEKYRKKTEPVPVSALPLVSSAIPSHAMIFPSVFPAVDKRKKRTEPLFLHFFEVPEEYDWFLFFKKPPEYSNNHHWTTRGEQEANKSENQSK